MISVLGVDGGQSAIRLTHSRDHRVIELAGVSRQEGDIVASVADAVTEGWRLLDCPGAERAVLGLTTAPVDQSALERLGDLVAKATGAAEVWITDDAVTGHFGALSGHPGVSLVVGTGVACLALRADGSSRMIGGHGYLLGDEGGGYWIGRRGLGSALRADDGRGPQTELSEPAERRFGQLVDAHVRLHDGDRPVDAIARFAPDVLDAASAGDRSASDIVAEAVGELLSVAQAGVAWVGGERVDLGLGGRLLSAGNELRRRLDLALAGSLPAARPRDADGSALEGAIALGKSADPGLYSKHVHVWRTGKSA